MHAAMPVIPIPTRPAPFCADLDVLNTAHPKPSRSAQAKAPGAKRMPLTSDIYVRSEQRPLALAPRSINKEALSARLKVIFAERYLGFILLHAFVLVR